MTKEDVLKQCTVHGNVVKLPAGQLDKKLFAEVKKALNQIQGVWKGGKVFGFEFKSDPTELLKEIAGGTKRNIKKEFQFYATPKALSKELVILAGLENNERVLEPSAGRGSILDAINDLGLDLQVECCELMEDNHRFLTEQGEKVVGTDFLKFYPTEKYDKIIANPPFTKNQDIKHLKKMYDLLNDTGKVVCVCSTSWIQTTTKESKAFRKWLDDDGYFTDDRDAPLARQWHVFGNIGNEVEFTRSNGDTVFIKTYDSTTFKESGASVKTCVVVIDRYTGK